MALHGLAHITIGVPNVDEARAFYNEFGLTESADLPGRFASADGGEQLTIVHQPVRRLVEVAVAADDTDDIDRIRHAAKAADIDSSIDGHDLLLTDPVVGLPIRVTARARIESTPAIPAALNAPGVRVRGSQRSPAIDERDGASPRRLGHVFMTTTDLAASRRFYEGVLGFRASDVVPGVSAFLRCSADHHNIAFAEAPVPFFHHSSWQVDDVDTIGHGAQKLLAVDPSRDIWGLGRHFLGSNYFWYFRDPSGNYAEYFADLDQIDDADWTTGEWGPEKSLYAWGPAVPSNFLVPDDIEELAAAFGGPR
jgi:catechol 2,3-dioxygenase-like lactoylglutathione lyase family enzyme